MGEATGLPAAPGATSAVRAKTARRRLPARRSLAKLKSHVRELRDTQSLHTQSAEDVAEGVRRLAAAVDDLCRRPPQPLVPPPRSMREGWRRPAQTAAGDAATENDSAEGGG